MKLYISTENWYIDLGIHDKIVIRSIVEDLIEQNYHYEIFVTKIDEKSGLEQIIYYHENYTRQKSK